jgi:hypothetical protein
MIYNFKKDQLVRVKRGFDVPDYISVGDVGIIIESFDSSGMVAVKFLTGKQKGVKPSTWFSERFTTAPSTDSSAFNLLSL